MQYTIGRETARALSLNIIRDNEGKRQRRTRDEGVGVDVKEVADADADADEKRPGKTGEREKSPDERMGESRDCWFGSSLDFR
ncbi:hypothetical protein CSPX01_02594 [Colletotrichum filicis]|nr:hypothetical protein CSPX01_02594 [Colletotrichum filicis]